MNDLSAGNSQHQRISVVVPTRNEADAIAATLAPVLGANVHEVIVVDGQSSDNTAQTARALGATVISSPPGRGTQLNCGARLATGDVLLFLHADTILPHDFPSHVRRILQEPGVSGGAFEFSLGASRPGLQLIEKVTNWRARVLQMPYGDQALFLTTPTFQRVGGFANIPVMEDFQMVRQLRRLGRIKIAPVAAITSPRRWLEGGVCRTTLMNQLCIICYMLGFPTRWLARWRRRQCLEKDETASNILEQPGVNPKILSPRNKTSYHL